MESSMRPGWLQPKRVDEDQESSWRTGLNVIAGGAKSAYDLLRVADRSGGIGERPVTMLGSGRERGAWFVGVAAQRHDVINLSSGIASTPLAYCLDISMPASCITRTASG